MLLVYLFFSHYCLQPFFSHPQNILIIRLYYVTLFLCELYAYGKMGNTFSSLICLDRFSCSSLYYNFFACNLCMLVLFLFSLFPPPDTCISISKICSFLVFKLCVTLIIYHNLVCMSIEIKTCIAIYLQLLLKGLGLETQSYKFNYSFIVVTTPEPTVLPPSLIANLNPSSIATGVINSTFMSMWSPGITISIPSGNLIDPVTSVVLK